MHHDDFSLANIRRAQCYMIRGPCGQGTAQSGVAEGGGAKPTLLTYIKRIFENDKNNYMSLVYFEQKLKESSILVEPDVPIYDLREAMKQVGYPVEPRVPLIDKLQKMPLNSPEIQSLLNMAQEEEPPFPGARRILQWEQRIVFSHGNFAGEHPVNRKAKCNVYLRDLQEQTGLTDEALQLIARV
ncbi:hypothetical protein WJX82_006702 [Trebouxia sp. C0006]